MDIQRIGSSDGLYEEVPRVMGDRVVCLRAHAPNVEQKVGEISMVDSMFRNTRMFWYRVEKSGADVEALTSVREGDYVYVDMLARYADTFPVSFVDCASVLFRTDEGGDGIHALKGRVILEVVEPSEKENAYGFVQMADIDPHGIVRSIGEGCEPRGYSVGDRVTLHKSDDNRMYVLNGVKYFDCDYRLPSAKFGEAS